MTSPDGTDISDKLLWASRMRNAAIFLCLSATVCGVLVLPTALLEAHPGGAGDAKTAVAASGAARADAGEAAKYIGPGSCAATSCHGSVKPIAGSRILQDEYSTWIIKISIAGRIKR